MIKNIFLSFLTGFVFFFFSQPGFCACVDDLIAIIQIYNQEGKAVGKEAGVFISKDEVLTHYYVFSGVDRAMLEVKGREFGIKGVCARNKEKKLLKLKIDGKGFKRAKFAKKIKEGQEVFIMLPEGEPVRGKIIAIKDRIRIEVNAQVPKIRGLPVFNKDEEVLGIVEFFIKDKNDVYAIPVLEGISFKNTGLLSINGWKQMRTKEWMESDIGKRQIIIYLMGMEKYEEAAVRLEKLIKAHPDDKEAYFRLGVCYGKRGEYQKAKDAYEKYTSLVPDDLKGHYNLGIAYLGTGDIQAAKREYEFLKRIGSKEAAAFSERLLEYIEKEEKP